MSFGFPNNDHYEAIEESFWPSFTDIMMVIVMVFLLVTVSVILNNYHLIENLKTSMQAQQMAKHQAEDAQIENSTLAQRLQRLKQTVMVLNQQLLDSKNELTKREQTIQHLTTSNTQQKQQLKGETAKFIALGQRTQQQILKKDSKISYLKQQEDKRKSEIKTLKIQLTDSKTVLIEQSKKFSTLEKQRENEETKLLSLQGELDSLDKKYQKLLRPARSSKGKTVVAVMYSKRKGRSVYRLRKTTKGDYQTLSRARLSNQLGKLKKKYKTDLYVKVIIPENSGLSYNEAWRFTNKIQKSYDYYYQDSKKE